MEALWQFEILITIFFQSLGGWLLPPMKALSFFGNEEFYLLIMPALYWSLDARLGLRVAVMLLLSNGLNTFLKFSFHSPRPYWFDTRVEALSSETSFGMPSGHAQNAASIWGLIAASIKKRWGAWLLLLLIFLIGLSRIYLGVHFTSDVIVGWLTGGLLLFAFIKLERRAVRWFSAQTLALQIMVTLSTSLVFVILPYLVILLLGNWIIPPAWLNNAALAAPEEPIQPLDLSGSITLAGTWLGMILGILGFERIAGRFNTDGPLAHRLGRYLLGIIGILIFWFGLGQVFPRSPDFAGFSLRYLRYTLIGLWITAFAPLLFIKLGLSKRSDPQAVHSAVEST